MQTLTQTRLQLRPVVNYAPLEDGIEFQHWDATFSFRGQPALYRLFQMLLPALETGSDLSELLTGLPEKARKAAHWLLDELQKRDALIRMDTPPEVGRFEQSWSYLMAVAQNPTSAFLKVRQARIEVIGDGALARITARTLSRLGIGQVHVHFDLSEDLQLTDPALTREVAVQPDLTLYALLDAGLDNVQFPALQGVLGRERGVISPVAADPEARTLTRVMELLRVPLGEGHIPDTTRNLFSNLLALEAFRTVAGVPTPVMQQEAVLIETAQLSSKTVKLPEARPALEVSEAVEQARQHPALNRTDILGQLSNVSNAVLGLLPEMKPVGVQMPLFAYSMDFQGNLIAGWGADGAEAQFQSLQAGVLHLLNQQPLPETAWDLRNETTGPVDSAKWVPAVGAGFDLWVQEGIRSALLQAWKTGNTVQWTTSTVKRHQLPLHATWLFKSLPLIYQKVPTLEVSVSAQLPGLQVAVVRDGEQILGAAVHEDLQEAWLRALKTAVASLQLTGTVQNAPRAFETPSIQQGSPDPSRGFSDLLTTVQNAGFKVKVHPWVQETSLSKLLTSGWVMLDA
ncbi:hypothetical protein [Deinococcus misasensis]|uniref:hypothetical protein n=1 Tax=Deinococcus misasensis TaxID=392413 RepID=UPI000552C799|nr:hypothetical protein [Deinococcus misasensis]